MLQSVGSAKNTDNCAVCYVVPGEGITFTPVSHIIAMKPAMEYIDKTDERIRKERKKEEDDEGKLMKSIISYLQLEIVLICVFKLLSYSCSVLSINLICDYIHILPR